MAESKQNVGTVSVTSLVDTIEIEGVKHTGVKDKRISVPASLVATLEKHQFIKSTGEVKVNESVS